MNEDWFFVCREFGVELDGGGGGLVVRYVGVLCVLGR